jgi:Fe-S-cluster containining protein
MRPRTIARYVEHYGPRAAMKMVHGHCAGLHARQGHFTCRIYGERPEGCRIVAPGSAECMTARRKHQITG